MLVKSDFTLRRYNSADDVESTKPATKAKERIYQLSEIEYVAQDLPPRFFLRLKSRKADAEGEAVKLSAETDIERQQWMREITALMQKVPREEDDDDEYRACGRRARGGVCSCDTPRACLQTAPSPPRRAPSRGSSNSLARGPLLQQGTRTTMRRGLQRVALLRVGAVGRAAGQQARRRPQAPTLTTAAARLLLLLRVALPLLPHPLGARVVARRLLLRQAHLTTRTARQRRGGPRQRARRLRRRRARTLTTATTGRDVRGGAGERPG